MPLPPDHELSQVEVEQQIKEEEARKRAREFDKDLEKKQRASNRDNFGKEKFSE